MIERNKERFLKEMREILNELRNGIIDVINGIAAPESLTPTLGKWYAKRQLFNNQQTGIILGCNQLTLVVFPITGDPKLDLGQKTLAPLPEITEHTQFDGEFLKKSASYLSRNRIGNVRSHPARMAFFLISKISTSNFLL